MGKSTAVVTDLASAVVSEGGAAFGATAVAAAVRAAGPIASLDGMANLAHRTAQELLKLLTGLVLDSTGATTYALIQTPDPTFAYLDGVRQVVLGTGGGKSTQVISDLDLAAAATIGATALAAAIDPKGPNADLSAMIKLAQLKARELLIILKGLVLDNTGGTTNALVKAGDPNFTALDNVRQVMV